MIGFYYNACGNTFLVVDNLNKNLSDSDKSKIVLKYVKDRDGVIFIQDHFMDYYNRDGKRADFCGNGARTYFAYINNKLEINEYIFNSYSGEIRGFIKDTYYVSMPKIINKGIKSYKGIDGSLVHVGVPHLVIERNTKKIDWNEFIPLRNYFDANINIYEEISTGFLRIRTFERGVERETGACGSGSTATAYCYREKTKHDLIKLKTNGGTLKVLFSDTYTFLGGGVEKCSEELELQL